MEEIKRRLLAGECLCVDKEITEISLYARGLFYVETDGDGTVAHYDCFEDALAEFINRVGYWTDSPL